ncbi:aspartate kinase [Variovorax sp. J22R133]|uniref:amino acid kinase family protein n=1 Tax=Variovorax brevis TaxID=3053503 RepID=UPI0025751B6E|nr:aspartate kinase [Variovorax sp. J22R133]MDM0115984.1 aspartate kinase [Variovorax sp. J22R133]
MWIVKIGGSLHSNPMLPVWLDLLAECGGGRVIVVCGGGRFADEVRNAQAHWRFSDLSAHNMAILAMAQTAYLVHGLNPALQLTRTNAEIHRVLHKGKAAIWLPFELQRTRSTTQSNWEVTSDSIALDLAYRLNAERLVLVKSCEIDPRLSLAQLGETGVVDQRFGSLSEGAAFPIDVVHFNEVGRIRALLLGEVRFNDA